jgi:hypothetical protein
MAKVKKSDTFMVGPVEATDGKDTPTRMAILLWGPATVGKTTFAATAPGIKLWLALGDNEHVSVADREDVKVANLSGLSVDDFFKHAQGGNPFGLDQILATHQEIETVVWDSATALSYIGLKKAIKDGVGKSASFQPTTEAPGLSAYGGRNGLTLEILSDLLRVTAKHNAHCIITAHEDDPVFRKDGNKEIIDYISVQLGGKIVNNMTWRLSEIWHLKQEDFGNKDRVLSVRQTGQRRPMKSRMFASTNTTPASFKLRYDATKPDKGQMTIASFYEQWMKNDLRKIPVPGSK